MIDSGYKPPPPPSRKLIAIGSVIHLLCSIAVIILATLAANYFQPGQGSDVEMPITRSNWEHNFILDITTTSSSLCPQGYESMFRQDWPGTFEGCDCELWKQAGDPPRHGVDGENTQIAEEPDNFHSSFLRKESASYQSQSREDVLAHLHKFNLENQLYAQHSLCSAIQKEAGCKDVNAQAARQFSRWKQHELWCVQRTDSVNFKTMREEYDTTTGACKQPLLNQVCGDPTDREYQFCFPKKFNGRCPINNVLITNTYLRDVPNSQLLQKYYVQSPLPFDTKHRLLYVSRTLPQTLPLSHYAVSESSKPCLDGRPNTTPNRQRYQLLNGNATEACNESQQEKQFDLLDTQAEHSYFYNNYALPLRDLLPRFEISNTVKVGLYVQHFQHPPKNCTNVEAGKPAISWNEEEGQEPDGDVPQKKQPEGKQLAEDLRQRQTVVKMVTYGLAIFTVVAGMLEFLTALIPGLKHEERIWSWVLPIQLACEIILLPFSAAALHHAIAMTRGNNIQQAQETSDCSNGVGAIDYNGLVIIDTVHILVICLVLLIDSTELFWKSFCGSSAQRSNRKMRRASTY